MQLGCQKAGTDRAGVNASPRVGVVHASTVGDFDSSENGAFQFRKPMVAQKLKLACPYYYSSFHCIFGVLTIFFWIKFDPKPDSDSASPGSSAPWVLFYIQPALKFCSASLKDGSVMNWQNFKRDYLVRFWAPVPAVTACLVFCPGRRRRLLVWGALHPVAAFPHPGEAAKSLGCATAESKGRSGRPPLSPGHADLCRLCTVGGGQDF